MYRNSQVLCLESNMRQTETTWFSQCTNQVDHKMNHKQTYSQCGASTIHLWVTLGGVSSFVVLTHAS